MGINATDRDAVRRHLALVQPELGYEDQKMADELNISLGYYHDIKRGKCEISRSVAAMMQQKLYVNLSYLGLGIQEDQKILDMDATSKKRKGKIIESWVDRFSARAKEEQVKRIETFMESLNEFMMEQLKE